MKAEKLKYLIDVLPKQTVSTHGLFGKLLIPALSHLKPHSAARPCNVISTIKLGHTNIQPALSEMIGVDRRAC